MALKLDFTFNETTFRRYLNGFPIVLHCHHYITLTTKLAEEFSDIGGIQILREAVEDSIGPLLSDYCERNGVVSFTDRLEVARQYYSVLGLGTMEIGGNEDGGEVLLKRSHVDEGWIKKFGPRKEPVNHFTCGYVSAAFAVAASRPARSYKAGETECLVSGAKVSKLIVQRA
jgi:hypothetical protein